MSTSYPSGGSTRAVADWAAFRPLWIVVALLLALLLLLLWFRGYGPGGVNRASCCLPGVGASTAAIAPAVTPAPTVMPSPAPSLAIPVDPRQPDASTAATPASSVATTAAVAPMVVPAPVSPPPAAKVFFARDRVNLRADTPQVLADVVAYLKAHPQALATISGFHDPTGSAERNKWLANNRARMVQQALMTAGVDEQRLRIAQPTVTTGTGPPHEARRVEVSVEP